MPSLQAVVVIMQQSEAVVCVCGQRAFDLVTKHTCAH